MHGFISWPLILCPDHSTVVIPESPLLDGQSSAVPVKGSVETRHAVRLQGVEDVYNVNQQLIATFFLLKSHIFHISNTNYAV